jgi:CDK-activating kinase assembly factor MAT1
VESDFPTLLDYNNYLEEVEDISKFEWCVTWRVSTFASFSHHECTVYSIVNELPNAEECKAKVKKEEETNKSLIVIRQSQRADQERSIADQIAAERRELERRKREYEEEEQAIALAKRKFKQESEEVLLGEREEVSAELKAAQMQGYRNELKRQARGKGVAANIVSPRVREPEGGLGKDKMIDREFYRKRQAAGGGIPSNSHAFHERNWTETVTTLFANPQ